MSFLPEHADDEVMNEINMTPLIDVMLVLLIVFILAVPALQNAIPLTLPEINRSTQPSATQPVRLDINAQGQAYWNGTSVTDQDLAALAQQVAQRGPQPVMRLRGDRQLSYERMLQVIDILQASGLKKIHFVAQQP